MPQLNVLDHLSLPGRADRPNDDAFGFLSTVAFVLDGTTSLGDVPLLPGASDAAWVAQTAAASLVRHAPRYAGDLDSLVFKAARDIKAAFDAQKLRAHYERYEIPYATLAMCGITNGALHVAFLGDSRILVRDGNGVVHHYGAPRRHRKSEQNLAQSMIAKSGGMRIGVDTIRQTVLPELRASRARVNTSEGYWLLGPDPQAAAHVSIAQLKVSSGAMVLLVTDGFYALAEDYAVYDDASLIDAALSKGLKTLGHELREIESDDPGGLKFARMKQSDDATAVLVRIEG